MKLWILFRSPYNKIAGVFDSFEMAQKTAKDVAVLIGRDTNPEWQSYGDVYYTYDEHGAEWSQGIFELHEYNLNMVTLDIVREINTYASDQALAKERLEDENE